MDGPSPPAPAPPVWLRYEGGDAWNLGLLVGGAVTEERLRRLRTEAPRALERLLRRLEQGER